MNVSITITVQEKKIYFEAESMGGFCFNLKELEYSEKDQDSLLVGNGLSLVVDQTAMRRLLNGNRRLRTLTEQEKRERTDIDDNYCAQPHSVPWQKAPQLPNYHHA